MAPDTDNTCNCPVCGDTAMPDLTGKDLMFGGDKTYNYYRCIHCSAIFIQPIPDNETIASFYPDNYSIYEPTLRVSQPGKLRRAVLASKYGYSQFKLTPISRAIATVAALFKYRDSITFNKDSVKLLDVGCGPGRYLLGMKQLGWDTKGVEFNQTAVDIGRKHGLDIHYGDLQSAGFDNDSFDVVTARHIIEHVPDPKSFIEEIARILKPGGKLVLETPNGLSLGRIIFGRFWFANEIPRHLFLLNIKSLDTMASDYGLNRTRELVTASKKIFLNSIDYKLGLKAESSKRKKLRRLFATFYSMLATLLQRGDVIHVTYQKS